jgi:leader peptidase (prepilin peptidase)/N-methyltransferase
VGPPARRWRRSWSSLSPAREQADRTLNIVGPSLAGVGPFVAALVGLAWGYAADRLAARWPAHEDGSIRPRDWRTLAVVATGAIAGWLVTARFGAGSTGVFAVMAIYTLALVVLFATDLDQRLLPDVITFPLIGLAIAAVVLGIGPYISQPLELGIAIVVSVVVPVLLYLLSIPFGPGAIGQGDLKLLVSVGLLGGPTRLFYGLVVGAILAAAAILVLLAAKRITLRSFVPYGPFLILGAIWALLVIAEA